MESKVVEQGIMGCGEGTWDGSCVSSRKDNDCTKLETRNHFTYVCLPRTAVFMLSFCISIPYLPFWINLNIFPSFISFSLPSFNFIALYHAPHFILEQDFIR